MYLLSVHYALKNGKGVQNHRETLSLKTKKTKKKNGKGVPGQEPKATEKPCLEKSKK